MDEIAAAWARYGDLSAKSPKEVRRIAEEIRAPWTRGGPAIASTESTIAGVRVRCYGSGRRALIYLHGGGWTYFSIDTHDRIMREYSSRAGVMVIGVDYALAPEAKYPLALQQVVAAVKFFAEQGLNLAIGGDSAGANLAISACLHQPGAMQALLLNYGVFDRQSNGPDGILTRAEMETFWHNYLRDERDAEDPLVCPLLADLRGLPRTLLVVPEFDLLTEQSLRLAERLQAAGVPVQLNFYRGATHSFLEAVSISSLAHRAFDDTAKWLTESGGSL